MSGDHSTVICCTFGSINIKKKKKNPLFSFYNLVMWPLFFLPQGLQNSKTCPDKSNRSYKKSISGIVVAFAEENMRGL